MGPWPTQVGLCTDPADWLRFLKRHGLDPAMPMLTGNATTHDIYNEKTYDQMVIIAIGKYKSHRREVVAGLIAHEALHVVEFMRHLQNGETLGSEAEAYLVQHITLHCLDKLWRRK